MITIGEEGLEKYAYKPKNSRLPVYQKMLERQERMISVEAGSMDPLTSDLQSVEL